MDTNYRSSRAIVEQVNVWFTPVMEGYHPQQVKEFASEGYVEVVEVLHKEDVKESKEEILLEALDEAKKLIALGVSVDTIAFLVHTNKEGQLLQMLAQQEGIDVRLKTTSSLKYVPKIAALVAMVEHLFYGHVIDAEAILTQTDTTLDALNLSWFTPFMSPYEVLHRLIRVLGYFDEDANLLKLLEFAISYNDIPTFLEEFAQSREEVASAITHGAEIMTIHGSKGLEFEYVILLDRLTKEKADTSLLLFDYGEDLRVQEIYYRQAGRELFDANYADYSEVQKRIAKKDKLNVLYVALTRAVEGLIVIKKEKASVFDPLQITPMKRGSIEVREERRQQKKREVLPKRTIMNYGLQEVKSESEEEEKEYAALLFGTALHYTLEMLATFTKESLGEALVATQNRYGERLNSKQLKEIEKRTTLLLEEATFRSYLKDANIHKEQPFSFHGEQRQVDLLLEYQETAMVCDYKSSKKYALKHQQQVGAYMEAMGAILNKPTKGMIVYLLGEGVELQPVEILNVKPE
jgi:exodeoxyribonuclease V beta subunit